MSDNPLFALTNSLIAGRFAVDTSQVLIDAGGGLPACLARDRLAGDGRRVAVAVSRDASPRARHLKLLVEPIDNLLVPLGHGIAPLAGGKGEGYFVVCAATPGPPVSASLNAWPDKALLELVLRPIARVLDALHSRNLTHRAIRPNNVFQSARGQAVTLGAAWAAPPAMHQPAVFEPPYSAMCHPAGRGEGSIADDVYALGVLLLTLSAGRVPMANMDDQTVIRWKLDLGSFASLTRDVTLSSTLTDLLRGMLADDPEHRPLPAALLDPGNARGRRITARPSRRSQRPLMLDDIAVFDSRMLGFALLQDERKAIQFLRNGLITQWLRRGLGDAGVAAEIEDLVRGRLADTRSGSQADALLVTQTIGVINPRMPLCWRGVALWPDALPALLAHGIAAQSDLAASAQELLVQDTASTWSATATHLNRPEPVDLFAHRHHAQGGGPSASLRLFYSLNPLLPCRVPAMATSWIVSIADLLRFLERSADAAGDSLIDLHIAAFIAARTDRKIEMQVHDFTGAKDAEALRLAELRLLQDLQTRYHPLPMPAVAKWAARRLRRDTERCRNRSRREAMQVRMDVLAEAGSLSQMLALANDRTARALDLAGVQLAARELAMIDAEVAAIDHEDKKRLVDAERFGHAIAGGIGLSAFVLMVMSVLLR